jgi:LCP family protein required for cell wall assembly
MPKEETRRKTPFRKIFIPLFLILLLLFTAGVFVIDKYGFFGLFGGDIMEDITPIAGGDSDFAKKYKDSRRVNVLVLGQNSGLTDTIMLASFDTEVKRVDIISVPRDTYYPRPEYKSAAFQKINSVYETGAKGDSAEAKEKRGVAAAKAVSEVLAGVPIHFYGVLDDDAVVKIVDSMDGIEMDVPMDMKYTDKKHGLYIDLKKGKQILDGDHAVQYLRYRKGYAMGDLGRVNAQQEFMKEAFKQSIGIGFPKVASTVQKEVDSNIGAKMAVRIASEAVGMTASDSKTWTTPGESKKENGAWYYIVDKAKTVEMMNEIYSIKKEKE